MKIKLHKQYMFIKLSNKPNIGKIDRIMMMWQIYEVDQNSNASILIICYYYYYYYYYVDLEIYVKISY